MVMYPKGLSKYYVVKDFRFFGVDPPRDQCNSCTKYWESTRVITDFQKNLTLPPVITKYWTVPEEEFHYPPKVPKSAYNFALFSHIFAMSCHVHSNTSSKLMIL